MPPAVIIAAGLTAKGVGDYISGNAQANAAEEQLAQAQKAASFATPTQAEMETLDNQIKLYQNSYSQSQAQLSQLQQQVVGTYGASIVSAGQQLLTQLNGGQSAQAKAAQEQVDRQKSQMQAQLIAQLGPGAMTTSAGIQAMANFNFQANQYLTNVQTQSVNNLVNQLGSLQGSQSGAVNDILNVNKNLSGMLGQIQSTQFQIQQRQVDAQMGITKYAGADQVGAENLGNTLSQIGGAAASAASYFGSKSTATSVKDAGSGINQVGTNQTNALNGFNQTMDATGGNPVGSQTLSQLNASPTNNQSIQTMSLGGGNAGSFNADSSLKMGSMT